ncbi:MAG TPA: anti-sigma factor [Sandaracinaceae bacterium]
MPRTTILSLLGALMLAIASCGGGRSYVATGRGPALSADARIDVVPVSAGNRQVRVHVEHLLPPERLHEDFSTYSVWIVPPGGRPIPVGTLDYDRSSRRGQLVTVTPFERFRVLVTAEPNTRTGFPTGAVVIDQDVAS